MTTINLDNLPRLKDLPPIFSTKLDITGKHFLPIISELIIDEQESAFITQECLILLHFALQLKAYDWQIGTFKLNLKTSFYTTFDHFLNSTNPPPAPNSSSIFIRIMHYLNLLFQASDNEKKIKFPDPMLNFENVPYQTALKDTINSLLTLRNNYSFDKKTSGRHIQEEFDTFIKHLEMAVNKMIVISLSIICFLSAHEPKLTLEKIFNQAISIQLIAPQWNSPLAQRRQNSLLGSAEAISTASSNRDVPPVPSSAEEPSKQNKRRQSRTIPIPSSISEDPEEEVFDPTLSQNPVSSLLLKSALSEPININRLNLT